MSKLEKNSKIQISITKERLTMKKEVQHMVNCIENMSSKKEYVEFIVRRLFKNAGITLSGIDIDENGNEGVIAGKISERKIGMSVSFRHNEVYYPQSFEFLLLFVEEEGLKVVLNRVFSYKDFQQDIKRYLYDDIGGLLNEKDKYKKQRDSLMKMFEEELSNLSGFEKNVHEVTSRQTIIVPDYLVAVDTGKEYLELYCGKERLCYRLNLDGSTNLSKQKQEWGALKQLIDYNNNDFASLPENVNGFKTFYSYLRLNSVDYNLNVKRFVNGYLEGETILQVDDIVFATFDRKRQIEISFSCSVSFNLGKVFLNADLSGEKVSLRGSFEEVMEELEQCANLVKII